MSDTPVDPNAAPVENVPVENVPVENVPVENVPVENVPVEDTPVEPVVPVYASLADEADAKMDTDGYLGWYHNPAGEICAGPTIRRPDPAQLQDTIFWFEAMCRHNGWRFEQPQE